MLQMTALLSITMTYISAQVFFMDDAEGSEDYAEHDSQVAARDETLAAISSKQ